MYVSIAHQILVFHDVVSDEMIFEHDMTNKKLKQIVKANILAEKEVTERDLILTMKAKDLKDRQEYYAATKLQFFYWKWTALRDMAKQRWKLEQHELSLMRKKEKKYALLWQTAWRKYLAKKVSWFRVQMHFQKIVEIENGRGVVYYYNHLTGDKTLTKPKVFWLLLNRRMGEDIDDPLPWSLQVSGGGGGGAEDWSEVTTYCVRTIQLVLVRSLILFLASCRSMTMREGNTGSTTLTGQ